MMSFSPKGRTGSFSSYSDDGSHHAAAKAVSGGEDRIVDKPTLIYHESARSIVFRDQVRRASMEHDTDHHHHHRTTSSSSTHSLSSFFQPLSFSERSADANTTEELNVSGTTTPTPDADDTNETAIQIHGFTPVILPLPALEYTSEDNFTLLVEAPNGEEEGEENNNDWTAAEREVVNMLKCQRAVVKTVKNSDWTALLNRFRAPKPHSHYSKPSEHDDIGPYEGYPFNSFVTSTSLLPPFGHKMRCFGSLNLFTTGLVFALPTAFPQDETEDDAAARTQTWSWPAGYSAKTEFNIDSRGQLINGRQEAIVPISVLRQYNDDYVHKQDHMIAHRLIKGGLETIPYNEVFVRVGGLGRIVDGKDCATGVLCNDTAGTGRSFDKGVGLPVALFVRAPTYGNLLSLLRTRARLLHVFGEKHIQGIPLLFISPELGVRVLTESLQKELLLIAARNLNPFQNPMLAHKTTMEDTTEESLEQKLEELIDLDHNIRRTLTPEECARLAGGFGATDESVAAILKDALVQDKQVQEQSNGGDTSHRTQDIVNEGLAAAVRAGDYHTARQLLLLYSLVSSMDFVKEQEKKKKELENLDAETDEEPKRRGSFDATSKDVLKWKEETDLSTGRIPAPPPPPPLDTERLRSATNSDGLLAVLGAAEVLKSMQDGSARRRTEECVLAVEEWVEHGEQSIAFRLASWRDQRAAQDDLKIATEGSSNLMAFVSNKAISNRKAFAQQLRESVSQTDFTDFRFLQAIHAILSKMHSPCLRLELLQYVLGLDNRFSVAHVARSIELAATCLSIGTAQAL